MAINQHVMIPVDFTDLSMESVRTARDLVLDSTEITLLYIYDPSDSIQSGTIDITPHPDGLPRDIAERLQRRLQRIRERELSGIKQVNIEIVVSRFPAEAICKYAREESVDLIIVATHGRSGLSHLLLGSVAEEVVRKAACPVLVARLRRKASQEQPAGEAAREQPAPEVAGERAREQAASSQPPAEAAGEVAGQPEEEQPPGDDAGEHAREQPALEVAGERAGERPPGEAARS